MKATRLMFVYLLGLCLSFTLVVGCESGGGDDDDSDAPAQADNPAAPAANWAPYVGTWHGSGLREVWFSVAADDGTVTMWDNVNPDAQSVPWNDSLSFFIEGGPTCHITIHGPNSATVKYTSNEYNMTKI